MSGAQRSFSPSVAVLTGLAAEARALRRGDAAGQLLVGLTGADPARARAEAERLATSGATVLVSFGLAGGLDPALRPGDVVVADRIVSPDASGAVETDARWRSLLLEAMPRARAGAVAGSDRIVATAAEKRALFERTGAAVVDMESHVAAQAAAGHGMPVVALRAVADPSWRDLPAVALVPQGPDGTLRLGAILRTLATRPDEWPRVAALARDTWSALAALRAAGSYLTPPRS